MNPIIPAIMPSDFFDIRSHVSKVLDTATCVQLDIMDGKLVDPVTWPFIKEHDEYWNHVQSGVTALPLWEDIDYELDLMIDRPEATLDSWINLEPLRLIVHFESVERTDILMDYYKQIDGIIERGISLNNDTSIDSIAPFMDVVDFVQVMGIARIGYQGQSFDTRVVNTVEELQKRFPGVVISIDGSVNEATISDLSQLGISRFVAGSAVYGSGDPRVNIMKLAKKVNN